MKNPTNKTTNTSKVARRTARMRNLRQGTGSIVMIAAVVAIAVVLNVFIGLLDIKFDMTSNDLYSLSDDNKAFLDQVKDINIEIYGLFDVNNLPGSDYNLIMQLLEDYTSNYKNITVTYVDPDKNPELMNRLDPAGTLDDQVGDFIVINTEGKDADGSYYSAKKKLVKANALFYQDADVTGVVYNYSMKAENAISGAINYVASDTTPTIYYLTGHQESDFKANFSFMVEQLDYSNYAVEMLDLLSVNQVPEDAAAVMIINPKADISTDEKVKLTEYLSSEDGNLIVFCEADDEGEKFNNLQSVLATYNVSMNNDIVAEASKYVVSSAGSSYVFKISPNRDDAILTASNMNEYQLIMGYGRSIRYLSNYNQSLTQYNLMSTSGSASSVAMDENADGNLGSMMMGTAVSSTNGSKIAVFGSSTFIADSIYSNYMVNWMAGAVVFKSVVEWMVPVENTIYIQAKVIHTDNNLAITTTDVVLIGIVCIIIVPIAVNGVGVFVWLKRRHM